jgi:hypothetical protein
MSPKRAPGLAYRAVGGEVVGRNGRSLPSPALALLGFYATEAQRARSRADEAAARYCAQMAVELLRAVVAADDWRRAGGGALDPAVAALRRLAARMNPLAER